MYFYNRKTIFILFFYRYITMNTTTSEDRLIRLKELKRMIGLCPASIYNLINNGKFPKQIQLSERATAWRLSDINEWINSRPQSKGFRVAPSKNSGGK
jgi:prophage regulatory protein